MMTRRAFPSTTSTVDPESETNATLTVTLSAASGQDVTVNYATSNGTATAGVDYTARSAGGPGQPLTIPAGETQRKTFTVDVTPPPSLSIDDVTVDPESDTNATFTVTLSAASGQTVTVDYASSDGNATAGADYTATNGTLTFEPRMQPSAENHHRSPCSPTALMKPTKP